MPAVAPCPAGAKSAASMANLATKPESGGRPISSNAQPTKQAPRTASVPGKPVPILGLAFLVGLLAQGFHRDGDQVGARILSPLDQLDQEKEGADRERRTDQVEAARRP